MGVGSATNGRSLNEALWEFTPHDLQASFKDAYSAWRDAGSPTRFVKYRFASDHAEAASRHSSQQYERRLFQDKTAHGRNLWEALRKALVSGVLQAEGCPGSPNAAPVPIRANAWRLAKVQSWELSTIALPGDPSRFFNVQIFPPPEKLADRHCIARADAESACREWLIALMDASLKLRPKPKAHYQREALSKFEGLSIRSFGRAWDAAIAKTHSHWDRPGAPKKSQHPKSKHQ